MNNSIQVNVSIPRGIDAVNVLGPSDRYVKAIKEQIDDTLRVNLGRSKEENNIVIFGKEKSVRQAQEVFEKLIEIACSKDEISTDEVRLLAKQSADGGIFDNSDSSTTILKYGKKEIKVRTEGQLEYLNSMRHNAITVCIAPAGAGKALSHGTPVPLAKGGYKNIENIKKGDILLDETGAPTTVQGVFPQGELTEYKISFEDGRYSLCGPEHLWECYYRGHSGKLSPRVMTTEEMIDYSKNHKSELRIKQCQPVQYSHKDFKIHPYVIGAFLGDGCCKEGPLTISSQTDEIPSIIGKLCNLTPYQCCKDNYSWQFWYNDEKDYFISGNKVARRPQTKRFFADYLNEICVLAQDKRIPEEYKYGDVEQRYALLQGLLDTDGSIDVLKGRVSFASTSQQLIRDIKEVCYSLGFSVSERKPNIKGRVRPCYCIQIRTDHSNKQKLFRLSYKVQRAKEYQAYIQKQNSWHRSYDKLIIKSIEKTGKVVPMTCITVDSPNHLFLTKDYIVTHNTFIPVSYAISLLAKKEINTIVISRPMVSAKGEADLGALPGTADEKFSLYALPMMDVFERVLGREKLDSYIEKGKIKMLPLGYMRGCSLYKTFLLVDEAENMNTILGKLAVTRLGEDSKIVLCGDLVQQDSKGESGLEYLANSLKDVSGIGVVRMTEADVVRHALITKMLNAFAAYDEK